MMKILSLSGFVPEQICDTVRFTQYAGDQAISHYCGYVADYISQVLHDSSIDGAVFPRSCDSCRVLGSYLAPSGKFLYQFGVPARQDSLAIDYLAAEIKDYQAKVEAHYHVALRDILHRAELVNARNKKLGELYAELDGLSFCDYLTQIHTLLQQPLAAQSVAPVAAQTQTDGKKVYVVGSFLSDLSLAAAIEACGMKVVGDNLTESKRLFSAPAVPLQGDIYHHIAASILQNRLSPTQNNFRQILDCDLQEILKKEVQGVIFATQKFCEPYDYLYSVYKRMLDEHEIPVLHLSLTDTSENRKQKFALETFYDMI